MQSNEEVWHQVAVVASANPEAVDRCFPVFNQRPSEMQIYLHELAEQEGNA